MGLLEWFKFGRREKKTRKPPAGQLTEDRDKAPETTPPLDKVIAELEQERKTTKTQQKRLREMEAKFSMMQENWSEMLQKQQLALDRLMEEKAKLEGVKKAPAKRSKEERATGAGVPAPLSNPILEDKTFKNFVVDDANRFPYLAAEAVATGVGRRYNPLFIYGNVGVGKTHLLHAIANKIREVDPSKTLLYSSTEKFTDELLKALERDDLDGFRKRYRNIDVLLVDDIQMLSGKEATQTEFFHMFNHLYNSSKQIVLCSDRPPSEIKELEGRLRSRFEGGLIIDIKVPTFEGRRQILVNLAHDEGITLSTEVLDYMAFYLDSSVRELEGGFNRVTAYATLMKEPVTVSLVRKVLEGILLKVHPSKVEDEEGEERHELMSGIQIPVPQRSPYSDQDLDLEEETERLEQELLFELKRDSKTNE
ncbi:MAG: chromosomal replication initiator protein DnaA [Thermoplasmatota archaeon]